MRLHARLFTLVLFAFAAPLHAVTMQVEGPQDSLAGAPTINHCTLRKAVINANTDSAPYPQCQAGSGADVIEFVFPGTVTFALAGGSEDAALTGDLDITSDITIVGHPDGTTIDAADLDRIFDVHPGATLTLHNIHVRNGTGLGGGGAIRVTAGTLNLHGVTISASHAAAADGGGILATSSNTTIVNSTISGNTAAHHAGGIYIEGGTAAITSSTIASNGSSFSNLTGGIRNAGVTTLRNTIVGMNSGNDVPNLDGTFVSLGYNMVGELGFAAGNPTIVPNVGDQLDVSLGTISLGPLQNNGGPTPTRALQPGSNARDKGHSSGTTADQRGLTRPCDDDGIANAPGGDGGDIGAFEEQVACGSNAAPDAVDDHAVVSEDSGPNGIAVLANDTDSNDDPLTITAATQGSNGSVTFTAASVSYTPAPGFFGADSFTYTISDGNGGSDTATVLVTVIMTADTQPPAITASVATNALWSPNNKMVDVGLSVSATDDSGPVTTSVTVYSDEDDGARPDASGMLLLRAERSGTGDGRFYLIRVTATDAHGNTGATCLTVIVPKSQSAAHVASVQAEAAAAQSQCTGTGLFVIGD